jgi:DNA-binding transcriptional LysR family regulator
MELRDLQIFVAVAEAGGFRRASQQLGLDASAVSRRVSMLEDELGVSLFERNRAGVRLTGAGRRFLTDTRLALSHLDGAVRTASAAGYAGEGMVKIGVVASVSSSFPNRLIRTFKADFPNVALDIVEGSYGEHLAALMERTLDVAFVMDLPRPPGCEVEGLWSEPILAALPADDPRCARGVLDMQDMAADLFIVSQASRRSRGLNGHGRARVRTQRHLWFGGERDLPRRDLRPIGWRSAAVQRDLVPGQ